jgi:hypothetical protein
MMAKELYTKSELFRLAREFVEKVLAQKKAKGVQGEWFILSAKHHLLDPKKEIEPYDQSLYDMTPTQRQKWAEKVLMQVLEYCNLHDFKPAQTNITILAGYAYSEYLITGLKQEGFHAAAPWLEEKPSEVQGQWKIMNWRKNWLRQKLANLSR